jgi:hypothetical protein
VDAGVSPERFRAWLEMEEPHWLKAHYDKLNYQDYSYYSAPPAEAAMIPALRSPARCSKLAQILS